MFRPRKSYKPSLGEHNFVTTVDIRAALGGLGHETCALAAPLYWHRRITSLTMAQGEQTDQRHSNAMMFVGGADDNETCHHLLIPCDEERGIMYRVDFCVSSVCR